MANVSSNATTRDTNQGPDRLPPHEGNGNTSNIALVLSGGATHGDFQVGAVRCLYNVGVVPNIMCGTSVGSVNVLKLAEGESGPVPTSAPSGFVRGLAGLEKLWLELHTDENMWLIDPVAADLFQNLQSLETQIGNLTSSSGSSNLVSTLEKGLIGYGAADLVGPLGWLANQNLNNLEDFINSIIDPVESSISSIQSDAGALLGLVNYNPLEKLMRKPGSLFTPLLQSSGIKLRMAMVALEDGALRYVDESNTMLERDGITVVPATVSDPVPLTPAQIQQLQKQLQKLEQDLPRPAIMGPDGHPVPGSFSPGVGNQAQLNAAITRIKQELNPPMLPTFDVINAAVASSAIPMIVLPREMQDGRHYMDGGICTLLPISAAIKAGAEMVYGVVASLQGIPSQTIQQVESVAPPVPLVGISLRIGDTIQPDEVAHRDIMPDYPYPVPTIIIQPSSQVGSDIHDSFTVEPGLIRIRTAYGFMRAYDTFWAYKLAGPDQYQTQTETNSTEGRTAQITNLRRVKWDLEFTANMRTIKFGSSLPPAPYTEGTLDNSKENQGKAQAALDQLHTLQGQLLVLIAARQAYYDKLSPLTSGTASMPSDFLKWANSWEVHNWTPTISFP
jgi:NTE family protein